MCDKKFRVVLCPLIAPDPGDATGRMDFESSKLAHQQQKPTNMQCFNTTMKLQTVHLLLNRLALSGG